ncbi:MAG: CHAD domain-containing protein [Bacteroidales bacterium]|nr:CHAD domain-containing protein [Bacteroidales bacterium]
MEPDYVKLKDIKPALGGYIREAQSMLNQSSSPDDKVVHDVRVLMKKSRAVMRLISTQIEEEIFQREYDALREVGRIMCSWRETSVHRKTLKYLKKENPEVFSMLQENEMLEDLMKKTDPVMTPSDNMKNDLEKINDLLGKSGYRIRFQSMNNLDPHILIKELEKIYNIVIDNYLICRNNPKAANLHEFRKRAKDFLYQLYFFRPLNLSVVKSLEKKLDTMTQNLGKYNDLSLLIKTLGYKYDNSAHLPAMDELIVIIRDEQDRYLSKVWPSAYKIFCPGQKLVNVLGFRLLVI